MMLFKLGTGGKADRTRRQAAGDWYTKIRLAPYDFQKARLCRDKGTSASWAELLQAAVDRRMAGEPPDLDTLKKLPARLCESFELISPLSNKRRGTFAENVKDYIAELRTVGRDSRYLTNTEKGLIAVGGGCGWKKLGGIDRASFVEYLEKRREAGIAPRTLNNELATLRGFVRWCVDTRRMDADPLTSVKRADTTADRRRKRRALTPDEAKTLLKVAGPRKLVYMTALGTGLRRLELVRLQWRDVAIDGPGRACLELRAEATKAKRADVVPLPDHLVRALRAARPEKYAPTDPVFAKVPDFYYWHEDLNRAGIKYRGADGRIVGFHSMRVTFVSELERAGVSPRTIMELARHRDYKLTAGTYTDVRVLDTFGAAARLPAYDDGPQAERQALRREGTNDAPVQVDQILDQKGCRDGRGSARGCGRGAGNNATNAGTNAVSARIAREGKTPRVGLEPTTTRLTAGCSTIELAGTRMTPGIKAPNIQSLPDRALLSSRMDGNPAAGTAGTRRPKQPR